ncbi:twin-arginine translocase subunit TatC [Kineococcus radiotolerans]|uniref:Sec-independent protein translocase protein TatC n=1 Tax=Kineococcus radiotolerans (strain ATCC BAA-149 / DSM 14245 / SRS30216) TaxID=266940 RepID=A6W980_KINRD|nr:twin-arginine translocase subunit TatC [Kineococcus radiotolerans]ABS03369.1 Sec-independent protein translocase, TatC subunit [Kineococcus radiotolerans SRS30216 = ATCC BAA-149]
MAVTTVRRRAPKDPEGRMPLMAHLKELRDRVFKAAVFLLIGSVAGWFLWRGWNYSWGAFDGVFQYLQRPLLDYAASAGYEDVKLNFTQVGQAFDLAVKGAIWCGVIASSPFWIYQLWAFITPGLTRKERRYAVGFIFAAVPLFLAGAAIAYAVLPNAMRFLVDFTPVDAANLIGADIYLSFVMRIILAFGLGFLMPVVLVGLNFAHLLSGRAVLRQWRISVFLSFLFSALVTPTSDITTMLLLACPLLVLFALATVICILNDRRRSKNSDEPDYTDLSDDEASAI